MGIGVSVGLLGALCLGVGVAVGEGVLVAEAAVGVGVLVGTEIFGSLVGTTYGIGVEEGVRVTVGLMVVCAPNTWVDALSEVGCPLKNVGKNAAAPPTMTMTVSAASKYIFLFLKNWITLCIITP